MTERRPAGFNIPLGFYDGPEVRSIPRRIRAAAIGVWAMAGDYSASRLSDGYVDAETLKTFGCGPTIRAALINTRGHDGQPDPLWLDVPDGGIRIAKWEKWQRSRAEVTAYRAADAERKRVAREEKKSTISELTVTSLSHRYASTNELQPCNDELVIDEETSGPAETAPCPPGILPESGQSKTETKTEKYLGGYVERATDVSDASARDLDETFAAATSERGDDRSRPVSIGATRLVATVVGAKISDADRTILRIKASEAMHDGRSDDDVAECLRIWLTKTDLGPHGLLCCLTEVDKRKLDNGGPPKNKLRAWAELAAKVRADEQAQLANHHPKEIP